MPLPGGSSDKIGNRYEDWWTVRCMIDVMKEEADFYYLHNVVKDYFTTHALRLVVVEHLRDMKQGKRKNRSKEFRKTLSHWNYRELLDIIQLRCEEHRVSFRSVNPYKTSQRCPRCGHTQRENRNGEEFHCLQCGFEEQADIVGSMNILQRFLSGRYGAGFQTE